MRHILPRVSFYPYASEELHVCVVPGCACFKNSHLFKRYQVNGLFFAIGHDPASKFLGGQIELDEDGYIKTVPGHTTTNVPGRKGWDIG